MSEMDVEEGYGAVAAAEKSTGELVCATCNAFNSGAQCICMVIFAIILTLAHLTVIEAPCFDALSRLFAGSNKLGRFVRFAAVLAVAAVAVVALAGISSDDGKPAQLAETWEYANADKRTLAMLLQKRQAVTNKLQEEETAEEAPAEEAPAEEEVAPMHHIKNFAGTEQMMNTGEVAAQGAGADFQSGEVVGAGVHVMTGIGSGDGVSVRTGVINGQGVTAGSGEGMGTGMFAGEGDGTGMMVSVGSGVGSGHMITVGDGFVEGKVMCLSVACGCLWLAVCVCACVVARAMT